MRLKLVALFIALALCVTWFYASRQWAIGNSLNSYDSFIFTGTINGHFKELDKVWQVRIGALWMSGEFTKWMHPQTNQEFSNVFGLYNAGWLGLTLVLLIFYLKEPVFVLFAVFAGLWWPMVNTLDVHILPWDAPGMFIWTLVFILCDAKKYGWLAVVIVFGSLIKEDVALLAILPLFTKLSWGRKLAHFAECFAGCLLVRIFITQNLFGHPMLNTTDHGASGHLWQATENFFAYEASPHWNNILWVNAGLAVAVLMFKPSNRYEWGILTVLGLLYASLTITPIISDRTSFEVRQWTGVLPILGISLQRKIKFNETTRLKIPPHAR